MGVTEAQEDTSPCTPAWLSDKHSLLNLDTNSYWHDDDVWV